MPYLLATVALLAEAMAAFRFVAEMPGVDLSLFRKRQQAAGSKPGGAATCSFNSNHVPAQGIMDKYPYNGAQNGLPGNGKGGFQMPAAGDTAHTFTAPGPNDIRGPCPGFNAAANHSFLAHDGITTFNELAILLAVLGLTFTDGDIVTEKLSIGCDATTRTSISPILTGSELGLDGHNEFEADTSLTRDDFFLGDADNLSFNDTLFGMMTETTGGNYNRDGLALYRFQRYQQSLQDNPNFHFGPLSLLLFGTSSFLYEIMLSGTRNYEPDYNTISSFFGAARKSDGTYPFNGEENIHDNWTNRVTPYTNSDVTVESLAQYLEHPDMFGGSTGNGGFDLLDFGAIQNGTITSASGTPDASVILCLLYQLATQSVPFSINSVITPTVDAITFTITKLNPSFANLGCPQPLTK